MVGVSSAGSPGDITLGPGECAQCMTGAIIPNGADAIAMVEDTSGFFRYRFSSDISGSQNRETYSQKKEKKFKMEMC